MRDLKTEFMERNPIPDKTVENIEDKVNKLKSQLSSPSDKCVAELRTEVEELKAKLSATSTDEIIEELKILLDEKLKETAESIIAPEYPTSVETLEEEV